MRLYLRLYPCYMLHEEHTGGHRRWSDLRNGGGTLWLGKPRYVYLCLSLQLGLWLGIPLYLRLYLRLCECLHLRLYQRERPM